MGMLHFSLVVVVAVELFFMSAIHVLLHFSLLLQLQIFSSLLFIFLNKLLFLLFLQRVYTTHIFCQLILNLHNGSFIHLFFDVFQFHLLD